MSQVTESAPAMSAAFYELLADTVLFAHLGVVIFIVGGLVLVVAGNLLGWRWVNDWWFRAAHLLAIATVVAESWIGAACPLTTWESWLRMKAGATPYAESFIAHWMQRILFFDAPDWIFTAVYSAFGLAVVAAWWIFPPKRTGSATHN